MSLFFAAIHARSSRRGVMTRGYGRTGAGSGNAVRSNADARNTGCRASSHNAESRNTGFSGAGSRNAGFSSAESSNAESSSTHGNGTGNADFRGKSSSKAARSASPGAASPIASASNAGRRVVGSRKAGRGKSTAAWWAVVSLLWSCAATPASEPATPSAAEPEPPLQLGALTDYVPAAGLRWLIAGSPRYFAEHPALAGTRQRWLTNQRLQSFAQATAVDLRRTERALVAGFDLGTLYVADGSGWVRPPQEPFVERLAGSAREQRPHRQIWRITGLVGSSPQALVRVADAVLAIAVRDPLLARIVEYRARGRLSGVTPALRGAALSALPAELLEPGPLRAYALGPFSPESLPEGAGLLGAAGAIGAALEIEGQWLLLRVALAGSWKEPEDAEHLQALWRALAQSALGDALGLTHTREPVSVQVTPEHLQLQAALDAERVLSGVERLAAGRLEPLLGSGTAPQNTEAPQSPGAAPITPETAPLTPETGPHTPKAAPHAPQAPPQGPGTAR